MNSRSEFLKALVLIIVSYIISYSITTTIFTMGYYPFKNLTVFNQQLLSLLFMIFILSIYNLYSEFLQTRFPFPRTVGVIGFTGVGKTTLLTTLLDEAIRDGYRDIKCELKSDSTIKKVYTNLARLRSKEVVGQTTFMGRWNYNSEVTIRRGINTRRFKVDFGDYPGEESENLSRKNLPDLLSNYVDTEYFKWLINADVYTFVIDSTIAYLPSVITHTNLHKIIAGYEAVWQYLAMANDSRKDLFKSKPIVIIFNKIDVIQDIVKIKDKIDDNSKLQELRELSAYCGWGKTPKIPSLRKLSEHELSFIKESINREFLELISFFKQQRNDTKVIYTSSFASD